MYKIIISVIIFTILYSCEMPKDGITESSSSIHFSKEYGVFIDEYKLLSDSILYPNNQVIEAWTEYSWEYRYKNMKAEIVKDGFITFYIRMDRKVENELIPLMRKMSSPLGSIGVTSNKIFIDLKSKPDTIRLFYKNDNEIVPMLFVKK